MNVLWLDDLRKPWQYGYMGATWVTTAAQAIERLRSGTFQFASLDHDLLEEHYPWNCADIEACEGTGHDVTKFLASNPDYWPVNGVRIHTANEQGAKRMLALVQAHYGRTFQDEGTPFGHDIAAATA